METKNRLRYFFDAVEHCEMCGSDSDLHKNLGQRLNRSQGRDTKNKPGISVTIFKCRRCELIFTSPQPVPFDINDHYGLPPEEYWHSDDFQWEPEYFADQISTAKQLLPFNAGMSALDIGAGLGKGMKSLEKAGFDTYGFEPSEPFFARAIDKMGIDRSKIKLGMIEEMDYDGECFDFITFGAVLEHLYHPAYSIELAMRWLKPNGIVHIEVPYSNHLISRIANMAYKLKGTSFVTNTSPMHPPFHLYEFGLKSFEELGKKLAFTIEKKHHDVCEIFFVPKILQPFFRKYMEVTNSGMQLTVWLRKNVR